MTKHYRLFTLLLTLPAVFAGAGCGCDPGGGMPPASCNQGEIACTPPAGGALLCLSGDPCADAHPDATGWFCDPADLKASATCSLVCGDDANSACQPPPPLPPGVLSFYLDSTQTTDGKLHYSGYSPGSSSSPVGAPIYDDLVVGSFDPATYTDGSRNLVSGWTIVDGVPVGGAVTNDPNGWRGGIVDPGDDAGRYSSIASIGTDLYVAYENTPADGSPAQLKVAYGTLAGGTDYTWTTFVVDETSGGALYTSIAIIGGLPTIAYGVRQAAVNPGEQPQGWVRIATAPSATPTGATWDWTSKTDIQSTTTNLGCVSFDNLCATGDTCVLDGTSGRGYCATPVDVSMCPMGMCGTGSCYHETTFNRTACTSAKTAEDLPNYTGLFNNLVPNPSGTGAALVYYDRSFGAKNAANQRCNINTDCTVASEICVGGVANAAVKGGYCIAPGGTLWGVSVADNNASTWLGATRFVIDGYAKRATVAALQYDAGIGATLAIDPATGVWHVAYKDGIFERELYTQVTAAGVVSKPEILDAGYPNGPGDHHILGDNASIAIAGTKVKIVYSDASGLEARLQERTAATPVTSSMPLATASLVAGPWAAPAGFTGTAPPFPTTLSPVPTSILEYGFSRGFWATQWVDSTGQSWNAWLERANNLQTLPSGSTVGDGNDTGDTLVFRAP